MSTNDPHVSSNTDLSNTTIWIPPLPLKEQQRIDQQRKQLRRQQRLRWVLLSGFQNKTVWDYLQLLAVLAIPILIATGTLWFTNAQSRASLQIAQDQQQENALQTYLDRMSDLLFTEHLATSQPGDEVRQIARARTLTLLPQLNGQRKGEVIQFLYEAGLLGFLRGQESAPTPAIIKLTNADLTNANVSDINLAGVDLEQVDLHGAVLSQANLNRANLSGANLNGTDLSNANLSGAKFDASVLNYNNLTVYILTDLSNADLSVADLAGANLVGAFLFKSNLEYAFLNGTDLRDANLPQANLHGADLSGTDLRNANLAGTNLSGTRGTTPQQLQAAISLSGTILPDGSKHP